jgi:hypothetical protein
MKAWQTPRGTLYYGERLSRDDERAPSRPSQDYVWTNGEGWTLDLSAVQLRANAEIDTKAEEVRLRYITPGAGQAGTYLIKERQAQAYRDTGYGSPVPLMVQAEVDATRLDSQQAADLILGQRDFWLVKAADIERERRKGKIAVDASESLRAISDARDAAIAALHAL